MTSVELSGSGEARPLRIPRLEDLPDLAGRSVLVRATLDLPLGGTHRISPAAALRTRLLTRTLGWLAERAAVVTVYGDWSSPGARLDAGHVRRTSAVIRAVASNVVVAEPAGSVEDPALVDALVGSHDAFVNDSFQWSHLPLPSLMVPPTRLPAAAGRSLQHDLEIGEDLLYRPDRPFVAVIGGSDPPVRLHGLHGLILRADEVLIGGAMSVPVLQAIGRTAGAVGTEFIEECRTLIGLAGRVSHRVELPVDLEVARPDGSSEIVAAHGDLGGPVLDIGPVTARRYGEIVEGAGTLLWSGALGRAERPPHDRGTLTVAEGLLRHGSGRIVLGGDLLTAVLDRHRHLQPGFDLVGATDAILELLKSGDLPALAALRAGAPAGVGS